MRWERLIGCRPGWRRAFECRGGNALRRKRGDPSRVHAGLRAIRRRAGPPRAAGAGTARAAPPRAWRVRAAARARRRPPAACPRARSRRRVTDWPVSSRRTSSARGTSAPAGSQIETSSPTALGLERVVAQDPAREPLVGDHDPLLGQRAQDRVVQPHVLDDAVVVLERDPVADAQRLGDREHDPGDEVGQRLAGGEADDRGHERAGGEEAAGDLAEARELRERGEHAGRQQHQRHEPAHEAQPRVGLLGDPAAQHATGELAPARRDHAVEHEGDQGEGGEDDRCADRRVVVPTSSASLADMPPQPRCLLLDAMGTLLTFEPPAPHLRAALRAATGADVGERGGAARRSARRSPTTAPTCTRAATRPALAALRRASAEAMRPALPEPAASLAGAALTAALLDALRFHAYPEVPGDAARAAPPRHPARGRLQLGRLAARAARRDRAGAAARRGGRVGASSAPPSRTRRSSPAALELAGADARDAWHVGDSPEADVEGALAAGLTPVLVARDGGAAAARRRRRIAALDGLLSLLDG